jgi:hypothetical protein
VAEKVKKSSRLAVNPVRTAGVYPGDGGRSGPHNEGKVMILVDLLVVLQQIDGRPSG